MKTIKEKNPGCYSHTFSGKIARGYSCSNAHDIRAHYHYNGSGKSAFGGSDKWPVITLQISFQEGEEVKRNRLVKDLVKWLKGECMNDRELAQKLARLSRLAHYTNKTTHHLEAIKDLAEKGLFQWTTLKTPNPDAMRAYQGKSDNYMISVAQANITNLGITHEGIAIARGPNNGAAVMHLPKDLADFLYHQASAGRN